MDKRQSERFSPPAVGGASLLTVFAALCLTIFALLSLSTVQADRRLADASAQAVRDYYAADCRAQELLARLRSGGLPSNVKAIPCTDTDDNGNRLYDTLYSYTVPISETQVLDVEVALEADSPRLTVLRWQARPADDWETDEGLSVWDGEDF